MKKVDVKIGGRYRAKVSGELVTVRILREAPLGGWYARNEKTGRMVRIKTAARLRGSVETGGPSELNRIPESKRSLFQIFKSARFRHPKLVMEAAKIFL